MGTLTRELYAWFRAVGSRLCDGSRTRSRLRPSEASLRASEEYPTFPPPPPRDILADRESYLQVIKRRKFGAPRGEFEDNSLYALYRLYECFVLDMRWGYRNFLEHFWRQADWAVHEIPQPVGENAERYAFLACITHLLVKSFNAKVALCATRDSPAIRSPEETERARNRPESEKVYERVPKWAEDMLRLNCALYVPTEGGTTITDADDKRLEPVFLSKNIFLWSPHVHFT